MSGLFLHQEAFLSLNAVEATLSQGVVSVAASTQLFWPLPMRRLQFKIGVRVVVEFVIGISEEELTPHGAIVAL